MRTTLTDINGRVGFEVIGLAPSRPFAPDQLDEIHALLNARKVVLFRGLPFDEVNGQVRFATQRREPCLAQY